VAIVIASSHLSDEDFLAAFSNCTLPLSSFRHGDHLRLAWLQLRKEPLDKALLSVRNGIRKFALHNGIPDIFHETVTTAWVKLLSTHHEPDFPAFIRMNEYRLNRALLHRFWTPSLLDSEAAKRGWVPPDRESLSS
jgi:CDP-diacylglycerol--glycerol-3-phosphate 3-phosphatidyltransferase